MTKTPYSRHTYVNPCSLNLWSARLVRGATTGMNYVSKAKVRVLHLRTVALEWLRGYLLKRIQHSKSKNEQAAW